MSEEKIDPLNFPLEQREYAIKKLTWNTKMRNRNQMAPEIQKSLETELPPKYNCPYCKESFDTENSLNIHMENERKYAEQFIQDYRFVPEKNKWYCQTCNRFFDTFKGVTQHLNRSSVLHV